MEFKVTDKINAKDKEIIFQGLLEYNLARLEDKNPQDLGVYLKDDNDELLSGLIGNTHGNWLTVKYLWVSEALRGQSIGSDILRKAEEEARGRRCKYVFLDTFSFQAPEFYKKHGYKEKFVLEEYPLEGKRHYFTKRL